MKNATPRQIATISALIISGVILLILLVVKLLLPDYVNWIIVIAAPLVTFISGSLVFYYFMENFIYRKIKLIYKTIYDTKIPDGDKPSKPKIKNDIIDYAESEVIEWKKSKTKELKKRKKHEQFRKEFLGNVFHELKTPIFNIQGYLETLIDGGFKDENINFKFLNKANKNVNRMAEIVDDLQMISNLEDGSFALSMNKFDITKLVAEIIDQNDIRASKKNISLEIKEGCEKSFIVFADREMIQQVLNNLVTNSMKYGKDGGRTQVGIYDMNKNVLVEVTDNGIGIDTKHLPRIFERFYRVDKDRSRELGGSGLGLSIVKHIIEAHGQAVNVRSAPKVGSTFGFTLTKTK
ncbi:MAG: sensor histidine kinase [Bacteroidales bacterium]|nr:sensor histidine kinase [Bacteroidales bacterium]